jgi:hypothetical protein
MAGRSYGAGTIFQRGKVWYVSFWADGRQIQKSSGSTKRQDCPAEGPVRNMRRDGASG